MAHSKQVRNALSQIFVNSVWYNHRDGGFMLVYSSGINMDQMKEFKLDLQRALSPVERAIIDNSFLGTRILETNFNMITKYDTFVALKDAMLLDELITQDEYDNAETITDLMNVLKVRLRYRIYINEELQYCIEDTKTYENVILATKYEFDSVNGTW
jgi:tRNA U34 5-carboxymethylaminomethyl modifying enzyme MnmG/GidA